MPKIDYRCPRCGSRNVGCDALAQWNYSAQAWELQSTYDSTTCLDCEYEADQGFMVMLDQDGLPKEAPFFIEKFDAEGASLETVGPFEDLSAAMLRVEEIKRQAGVHHAAIC